MEFVILKLEGSYDTFGNYKSPIYLLGKFLTDDYRESYKGYINDPEIIDIEGNRTLLEKWGDNILIQSILYDSEEEMYKNSFTISKDELLKVIDKWNELRKQRPNYIKITSDNCKITMEGRKQVEYIEYLNLKLITNKYSIIENSKTRIKFFGTFLTRDFHANPNIFLNWINDMNYRKEINGNICKLRKSDDEIFINEFTHNNSIINDQDNTFFIKSSQLVEILNKLNGLFNQKVKEINITYKDDIYTIKAID